MIDLLTFGKFLSQTLKRYSTPMPFTEYENVLKKSYFGELSGLIGMYPNEFSSDSTKVRLEKD